MGDNLTKKTVRSANWGLGKTIGRNITSFFINITLARLIAPEEFGLLAIAMIFVGLGRIVANLGINSAIVQKKKLNSKNLRAALLLSILSGGIIYLIIWLTAPFAADFFNNTRANSVIRWIGILFLFNGFTTVGQGLLMRHFKYKPIFFIELTAYFLGNGITGIIFALLGYGVWSLVWGVLVQYVLMALFYLLYVQIPIVPVLKGGEYRRLFRFGGGVSLLGFFNYVAMNIDNLIIGRFLQAHQLGLYSKAFGLMQLPVRNLSYTLGSVSMSTFSAIQDEPEKLRKAYFKAVNLIFLIALPVTIVMILSAEYMVLGLYGPQWDGAVVAFRILSFSIAFKVFFGLSGSLAKATDNVFKETSRQFIFALSLGGLSLLFIQYGIEGVSFAVTLSALLFFVLMTQLSMKICGGRWRDFIKQFKGGAILSVFAGLINISSIFIVETFLQDLTMPVKLILIMVVLLISGVWVFINIPDKWIGHNRNWLIKIYAPVLPSKIESILTKNLK